MSNISGAVLRITVAGLIVGCIQVSTAQNNTSLDLSRYVLTFSEEFDTLDISAWGPGTRWIAHTPWNGDFGDASFSDPQPGFPFTLANGILRIEARKDNGGKWRSGLLASVDGKGAGFSQQFGYFEMRAKFPAGSGVWPAFWLIGLDRSTHTSEIDVVEHYGHAPDRYTASVHVWDRATPKQSRSLHTHVKVPANALSSEFHTYGVSIDAQNIRFYFNRQEVWSTPTPPEHHQPMYLLVNLSLGAGWPIDRVPNPSIMEVDYVRAWAAKN